MCFNEDVLSSLSLWPRRFEGACRCNAVRPRGAARPARPFLIGRCRTDCVRGFCLFFPLPPPLLPLSPSPRFNKPDMFTTSVSCLQLPWQRG